MAITPSAVAQVWVDRAERPEGACGHPSPGQGSHLPRGPAARHGVELLAKGSCTQGPPSTYIAVGSASVTAPLLPQGLRGEGTRCSNTVTAHGLDKEQPESSWYPPGA